MIALDLRAVDDLCRLALAARRLGCGIHLTGAGAELIALLDRAGVRDVIVACPADTTSTRTEDRLP